MSDPLNQTQASQTPPPSNGEQPSGQTGTEPSLPEQLASAQARADEFYDQFMRARAEMENVRRRAQEDIAKAHKFAIESFADSLLPVRDSLEMALSVASPSLESLREGVTATLRQLSSALEKNKVIEINPVGEKFDPNRHQAISAVPAAGTEPPVAPNHVVAVLQKGYLINDRVLRPALVTVAQG